MKTRVMIADDDIGMRIVIRTAVEKSGDFTVVGEAEDGDAALRIFEKQRPDVVFLDVEMPKVTGVECARRIADIDPKTVIIFATAHDEYMPDAFDVYAFDYLVKPFKMERLHQTLVRILNIGVVKAADRDNSAQEQSASELPKPDQSISEQSTLWQSGASPAGAGFPKAPGKLMIRNRDGISLIDMKDILLIQREERSTVIYTSQDRFTTSEGLSELEDKLDRSLFFRCHKSYMINLSAISKIYPYGRWTYIVKLKGTEKDALLTHEKYEEIERMFT